MSDARDPFEDMFPSPAPQAGANHAPPRFGTPDGSSPHSPGYAPYNTGHAEPSRPSPDVPFGGGSPMNDAHSPAPEFGAPPGFGPPPDFGPPPGFGPPPDFGPPPGFGAPSGFGAPPEFGPPPGFGPLPGHGPPDYAAPPGYDPPAYNPYSEVGNPSLPLVLAPSVAAGLAAVVAGFFGGQLTVAVVCWFLAGFVAIGLLAVYVRHDIAQRARSGYGQKEWARPLHRGSMVLIVIGVAVTSFRIADWISRL